MPSSRGFRAILEASDFKDPNTRKQFSDLGFFPKLIREKALAAEKWFEQPTIEEANEMFHQRKLQGGKAVLRVIADQFIFFLK